MKTKIKFKIQLITFTYVLLVSVIFSSCSEANNHTNCLNSVKRIYPNAKIYKNPENRFKFLVVDSTGIREVTTLNLTDANVDGVVEFSLAE